MEQPPVAKTAATTEIESPETVILQWYSNSGNNLKFGRDRREIQRLLNTVDELQIATDAATISDSTLLARHAAMALMEDVFRSILVSVSPLKNRLQRDPTSTYTDSEFSLYSLQERLYSNSVLIPDDAIHILRDIAERMIVAGYSRECIEVYTSVRQTGLEKEFRELEIEKFSSKYIQRLEWELQQEKIGLCLHTVHICVCVLFARERTLTKQIFNGLGANNNIADDCFMKTVKDSAIKLFNFVETITSIRKSPQKLFKILDLYDGLSDLLPDIQTIFGFESGEFIRKQAVEILSRLSVAAREILSEFEKAVFGEMSKAPIPGGSVHPLTKYVMNYVDSMVKYKQILIQLIVSKPSTHTHSRELDIDCSEFEQQASPLVLHLVWITKILKFNLKGKSKQYKDASLVHFFMMNNVRYIVRKIEGSMELREMIGDDYLNKLTNEYNLAASNYLKTSWKRVLDCMRDDALQKLGRLLLCGAVSKFVSRHRLKGFDAKFKEVLRAAQGTWHVIDIQLKDDLSSSILEMLIPVYASFLERHRSHTESGKQSQDYVKYSVEDVEKAIMNLPKVY